MLWFGFCSGFLLVPFPFIWMVFGLFFFPSFLVYFWFLLAFSPPVPLPPPCPPLSLCAILLVSWFLLSQKPYYRVKQYLNISLYLCACLCVSRPPITLFGSTPSPRLSLIYSPHLPSSHLSPHHFPPFVWVLPPFFFPLSWWGRVGAGVCFIPAPSGCFLLGGGLFLSLPDDSGVP